jgi:hypothetical protein
MNTTYTMSDIKSNINCLKRQSLDANSEKVLADFGLYLEEHPEIKQDIARYETACKEAENLHKKYTRLYSYQHYSNDLKSLIRNDYFERRQDEAKKIEMQFNAIIDKLKTMRNPGKTLKFLKLCGIELPEQNESVQNIPVDPEFIKSVLPAAKQLTVTD